MKVLSFVLGATLAIGLSFAALAANPPKPVIKLTSSAEVPISAVSSAPDMTSAAEASSASEPDTSSNGEQPPLPGAAPVTARDPQTVVAELIRLGYPAELEMLDDGSTAISLKLADLSTYIDFYNCDEAEMDCDILMFDVTLDFKNGTSVDKAERWNAEKISGKVWLDEDKDPILDYSLATFEGINSEIFDQTVQLWVATIKDFKSYFNFH